MLTTSVKGTIAAIARLLTLAFAALITLARLAAEEPAPDLDTVPKPVGDLESVRVTTRREGELTRFWVENLEQCEVTMTFEMALVNLKGNVEFPYTITFAPAKITEAFSLTPCQPGAKWEYSFTNHFRLGSNLAKHDDGVVYQLPYLPGSKYTVSQGYNGDFSHKGSSQYALDWEMPEGTVVSAARDGTVVKIKADSGTGGSSMKFDRFNNYVLIEHEDGTLAHYCHLMKKGVIVRVGQSVKAGDPIAHSGNTGYSSGPHLHFCVFKPKDGCERESIPVKFRTADEYGTTLVECHRYEAIAAGTGTLAKGAQYSGIARPRKAQWGSGESGTGVDCAGSWDLHI